MDIVLRDTTEADLPEIFRIRKHPLVTPNQYRQTSDDTIAAWKQHLRSQRWSSGQEFRCVTIVGQGKIIGHIIYYPFQRGGQAICYCGWDLDPQYWGQGLMPAALAKLFDYFFLEGDVDLIIADCFAGNARCLRLLEKLGFKKQPIPLYNRLLIAVGHRCLHWIIRNHLTADDWRSREQASARPVL